MNQLEELKAKRYIEVKLPGWDGIDVFECKLQRVNLLDLASKGKIPNPLIASVLKVFKGEGPQPDSLEGLKSLNELSELFAEVTMVDPTYKEVKEVIGLTDEQKMIIYNFALQGARAVEPFRNKSRSDEPNTHDEDISKEA